MSRRLTGVYGWMDDGWMIGWMDVQACVRCA